MNHAIKKFNAILLGARKIGFLRLHILSFRGARFQSIMLFLNLSFVRKPIALFSPKITKQGLLTC
jgi:hypothetical protein